jgi:hypothetical protein
MRTFATFLLIISLAALSGCAESSRNNEQADAPKPEQSSQAPQPQKETEKQAQAVGLASFYDSESQGNLTGAQSSQASDSAAGRKIIRNGELIIETDSPTEGQGKITAIAESLGGFVVTSEFKQSGKPNQSQPSQNVTIVARVPSAQFGAALEMIRKVGSRIVQEKVSGQDVSEEYLDLEARIRTKKALEAQFLEIMKQAKKVSEALEVQSQLADVRTEIERLEGRRRFLENQSAFSTLTTTLQMPAPIVAATTSGFGNSIKQAFGDGIDTAATIIIGLIRIIIVLTPVVLLVGLPMWFILRIIRRRIRMPKKPEPLAES